ncbi:MAG: sodium:proton antiporter [Planctomycetota bacterium]|nr:sodium:proton antiporter [Planctomycetota bacterium]
MHDVALKLAVVAAGGIFAQWVAWRTRLPAIVLLLVGGFVLGPLTGWLNPASDFGAAYRPVVSIAVAIILFEGGLTLNVAEIRETSTAVRRLILFAGPMVWGMTALAAHIVAGLSWPTATVLGAILVVTGPTVVMPLLRQAHLAARPASLLRWEAIVNDAIGALFAVIAFETFLVLHGSHSAGEVLTSLAAGTVIAIGGGFAAGTAIEWAFTRGHVPEYLKAPVLLATVVAAHALTNMVLEEAGLLTVTVMGIRLANSRIASLTEMRRFKETVTILLVSGLFLLLTAALDMEAIRSLDLRAVAFVVLVMFVIRPLAVIVSTAGSGISLREQVFVGWIAPRGIVAVAVSSLFAVALADDGVDDAPQMVAYTFAVVVATVFVHGFTLAPLATLLGLTSATKPGILILGGSPVTAAFATTLKETGIPVMIADTAWSRLREARLAEIPVYFGEVLSEEAHYDLDVKRFAALIATTSNDAYNALVCTNLSPEIGRANVFEIPTVREQAERKSLSFTLGGRPLTRDPELRSVDFQLEHFRGWGFQVTRITEEFSYQHYLDSRVAGARVLLWRKPSGKLVFRATTDKSNPEPGDLVISFAPPRAEKKPSD